MAAHYKDSYNFVKLYGNANEQTKALFKDELEVCVCVEREAERKGGRCGLQGHRFTWGLCLGLYPPPPHTHTRSHTYTYYTPHLQIRSTPCFKIYNGTQLVQQITGSNKEKLEDLLRFHVPEGKMPQGRLYFPQT